MLSTVTQLQKNVPSTVAPAAIPVIDPGEIAVQQSVVKSGADFNQLPTALVGEIGAMLSGPSHFSQTSHHTRLAMEIQYWDRLTPACRAQHPRYNPRENPLANPGALYADYANRQDRYLPVTYLDECGVTHQFLINQIKKGQCSLNEALGILHKNRQSIVAAEKGSDSLLKDALANPIIRHCVVGGLLTLEQIPRLSSYGMRVLKNSPVVLKVLERGELLMNEVERMTYDQMSAFIDPSVCECLMKNQLSLKDLLSMSLSAILSLRTTFVRQSLADKTLSQTQFLSMSMYARLAFDNPVVMKYLEDKQLSMQDVLNITESAYKLLLNPQVQHYVKDNPLAVARILNCHPRAQLIFQFEIIQSALISKKLSIGDFLTRIEPALAGIDLGLYHDFVRDGKGSLADYIKQYSRLDSPSS